MQETSNKGNTVAVKSVKYRYIVQKYSVGEDGDVKADTQYANSVEMAIKLWSLLWCDEPYMCEIAGTEENMRYLLEWVCKHHRDFYLIGTSTVNEGHKVMFEIYYRHLLQEAKESLENGEIESIGEGHYTAKPFTLG